MRWQPETEEWGNVWGGGEGCIWKSRCNQCKFWGREWSLSPLQCHPELLKSSPCRCRTWRSRKTARWWHCPSDRRCFQCRTWKGKQGGWDVRKLGQNTEMHLLNEKCGQLSHDECTKNELSSFIADWGGEGGSCTVQDVISHHHPSHTKGTGSSSGWFRFWTILCFVLRLKLNLYSVFL